MFTLDVRTVVLFAAAVNIVSFIIMALLWLQNRRNFKGISYIAADYLLQILAMVLIALRGTAPDWLSVTFPNIFLLGGMVLLMLGLQRFMGRSFPMLHNYLVLAVLVGIQVYASIVRQDLTLRVLLLNAGGVFFGVQSVLILQLGTSSEQRRLTRGTSLAVGVLALVTLARLIAFALFPTSSNDFFLSSSLDMVFFILQQLVVLFITFNLVLMLNGRWILEVKKSEERFRSTLENLFEGGQIVDFNWRYIFVNKMAVSHSRHSSDLLLGHTMMEVFPGIQDTPLFKLLDKCMRERITGRIENEFHYENGETRWFDLIIQPVDEGLFILSLDITDRKIAEDALEKSEDQLRLILNSAAEAIFGIDREGNCTFCNPSCSALLGYSSPADLLGKNMHELTHYQHPDGKSYNQAECPICATFLKGNDCHRDDEYFWRKNGSSLPVEYWSHVQIKDSRSTGSVVTFIDITGRRQEEARTIEMEALKQLNKARSELLANVSHELRTPLASIKGFVETLLEPDVRWSKKDQQDFLQSANVETDRLTFLIRDLLDMSRLDSGKMVLDCKVYGVNEIIQPVSSILALLTSKHRLACSIPRDLPPVSADRNRIGQVITNLVENAAKFSPDGSLIQIDVRVDGNRLVFSVEDRGEGMTGEVIANLFNRFFQAERVVNGKTRGTGLGLAICKGIIEAHGGRIWVSSVPGKGSAFSFSIPLSATITPDNAGNQ
jgi:PAS domain S-box-containing protein